MVQENSDDLILRCPDMLLRVAGWTSDSVLTTARADLAGRRIAETAGRVVDAAVALTGEPARLDEPDGVAATTVSRLPGAVALIRHSLLDQPAAGIQSGADRLGDGDLQCLHLGQG